VHFNAISKLIPWKEHLFFAHYPYKIFIIIIIILLINIMQNIYNYVPEINYDFFTVNNTGAILYLQSVLHSMLFRP
jgi:hypothetical protein